jgi:hypothetical protein
VYHLHGRGTWYGDHWKRQKIGVGGLFCLHLEQADRYLVKIRVPESDKSLPFGCMPIIIRVATRDMRPSNLAVGTKSKNRQRVDMHTTTVDSLRTPK